MSLYDSRVWWGGNGEMKVNEEKEGREQNKCTWSAVKGSLIYLAFIKNLEFLHYVYVIHF